MIFPLLRLLAVPVAAKTREALFPAKSVIVPPFNTNAFVPVYSSGLVKIPSSMRYWNRRVLEEVETYSAV